MRQAQQQQQARAPPPLHYDPATTRSVTQQDYRPPTAAELRAGSARAEKPSWSNIHGNASGSARFEGESVTRDSFRGAQNPRPSTSSSSRPSWDRGVDDSQQLHRQPLPFEAKTLYSEQFAAPSPEQARAAHRQPVQRQAGTERSVLPPNQTFDEQTTSRREYRAYDPAQQARLRPQSAAPARPSLPPSLPFTGVSQTKADFTPKQRDPSQPLGQFHPGRERLQLNQAQTWVAGGGPGARFEATSVTQDAFRAPPPSNRTQAMAPPPEPARRSLPFTGESQTAADFRAYDADTVRAAGQRRTGDAHASSYRTPSELHTGTGQARGQYDTETRRQFQNKMPPPCPATQWETPVGGRTPMHAD